MRAQPDPQSTNVLLARAQQGDERAFTLLYERYVARVRRWARASLHRQSRNVLDTDVLSQQVLTNVFLRIPSLRLAHEQSFKEYVRKALRNAVISANKVSGPEQVDVESVVDTFPDDQPTPLEWVIYRDTEQALARAFKQLDERHQQVIVLRRVEGRSHRQVAEALQYPSEAAARVACSRAYRRLHENIQAITGSSTAA